MSHDYRLTQFQTLMAQLDLALTGKPESRVEHTASQHFSSAQAMLDDTGDRLYYLSDGGYSRVGFNTRTGRLYLSSVSLEKPKAAWDSTAALRAEIEAYFRAETDWQSPEPTAPDPPALIAVEPQAPTEPAAWERTAARTFQDDDGSYRIVARWGLEKLGSQAPYFHVVYELHHRGRMVSCGAAHDEIIRHFPELAPFVKWHLTAWPGEPMHYLANAKFWAEAVLHMRTERDDDPDAVECFMSTIAHGALPQDDVVLGAERLRGIYEDPDTLLLPEGYRKGLLLDWMHKVVDRGPALAAAFQKAMAEASAIEIPEAYPPGYPKKPRPEKPRSKPDRELCEKLDRVFDRHGLPEVRAEDVRTINYQPHTPTIGLKAMAWTQKHSGGIDGAAPCDHPDCKLRLEEHHGVRVVFVYLYAPVEKAKAEGALKEAAAVVEAAGVEGFTFVSFEDDCVFV